MSDKTSDHLRQLSADVHKAIEKFQAATGNQYRPDLRVEWVNVGTVSYPHRYVAGNVEATVELTRGARS